MSTELQKVLAGGTGTVVAAVAVLVLFVVVMGCLWWHENRPARH